MTKKNTTLLRSLHVTEKTNMLGSLVEAESNPSVKKFNQAKYVFLVDTKANKYQIKQEVEEAYKSQNVKVEKVNTIRLPRKPKQVRSKAASFRKGATAIKKKAIVTLREGDQIDFES